MATKVEDGPWRKLQDYDDDDAGFHFGDDEQDDDEGEADDEAPDPRAGAQDASAEVGDDAEPQAPSRPQTKTELQKLRERFQNTMKLVAHLYHNLDLKDEFQMVSIACAPFMREYTSMLECQKLGQDWGSGMAYLNLGPLGSGSRGALIQVTWSMNRGLIRNWFKHVHCFSLQYFFFINYTN